MPNVKSIGGNPIVLDSNGLADDAASGAKIGTMTASTKGGAKLGSGLAVANDVLSIANGGVTDAMLANNGIKADVSAIKNKLDVASC